VVLDRQRIGELRERERAHLCERTKQSGAMLRRAERALAGGVASSFHRLEPWPVYMARGEGARTWDVDGNEYIDFHNGFSAMLQGHAHAAIEAAVARRHALGTHFGAPTEEAVAVAEELGRRFELPRWRFTNSGTEATMDAIRIARGLTGRPDVVKIFGSYHGHDDTTMVAIGVPYERIGPAEAPGSPPWGEGIPRSTLEHVHTVHFNDAGAMERLIRRLERAARAPACVIMEAAMTNLGLVPPELGYLEAVRDITRRHGVVLIFDEVKTGLSIAAGGAVERFGVPPDAVTLAKALGGGLSSGAIGMTPELAAVVQDGRVHQVGTFNGNPLAMAAARANLLEVLTPRAYRRLERLGERMLAGCDAVIAEHGLPAYPVGLGSKGCVTWATEPVVDYPSFKRRHDPELAELIWLWHMNRGILVTAGREQEWNLSVAHDEGTVDRYVEVFAALAAELDRGPAGVSGRSSGSARA
jgi:glutamate-1-semialdehyde 2,1-aminomutase